MLEFVLCFPIIFVIFLFVMQIAQIMITWQMVHYAAYMGARSAMTVNILSRQSRAEDVAKRVLAVVSASPVDPSSGEKKDKKEKDRAEDIYCKLDGWGYLPNTKYLDQQVDVDISRLDMLPGGVRCTVKFKMFLHVPVAGQIISFLAAEDQKKEDLDAYKKMLEEEDFRNPAMLAKFSNDLTVKKGQKKKGDQESDDIKYPYIELTSSSVVSIPYSTLFYPILQ